MSESYYADDGVTLHHGDALNVLGSMPDRSVDCIVTSPPYLGLRDYGVTGTDWPAVTYPPMHGLPVVDVPAMTCPLGLEPTIESFIGHLVLIFEQARRVLADDGTLWLNLGESSARQGGAGRGGGSMLQGRKHGHAQEATTNRRRKPGITLPEKNLLGIPWRAAYALQADGWILRNDIIWCLSGGSRVYARTATGDRPIMLRDLVRSYQPESVQLWNGTRWTQALGWNRTPDDDGALEFELRSGERIGCTPGHKWPTLRGVIRADEVLVGDVIETTRLPEPDAPRTPSLLPDEDIGWLVGLYIAEGSRSGTTVQFAGHVKEGARHARLSRIASALDGTCAVYRTGENAVTANLRGSVILGVIDRYVSPGTAKTKRLRKAAWQRSDAFLAALVDGYLSGDGHYDAKNDRWRLGFTENDEWSADLRTLAARLGAVLRLRRHNHQGFGGTFPGWRGEWRWVRSTHHNAKPDGEVVAIRRSRARDFYDLGVADDPHLFALASGVLTHNSKSNGMPESVRDRLATKHEHVFLFAKSPRYYFNLEPIREPHAGTSISRAAPHRADPGRAAREGAPYRGISVSGQTFRLDQMNHPGGRNPGDVWTIPTVPFAEAHFAVFPPALAERAVLAGCKPGGTVLDPFSGSGTTGMVAARHGHRYVGIDASRDYLDLSLRTRLTQGALLGVDSA